MKIALDAMGGDHAPHEIVSGAVQAASKVQDEILLVGDPIRIRESYSMPLPHNISIVEALQVIDMHEEPATSVRKKKDSSLVIAANLVRDGEADAMISAGNTGAATAAAHLFWKRLPGIDRPAIATILPGKNGHFVLLDSGATPDATPENLLEFAIMGSVYAEIVLGIKSPRVALLNIGQEETKGNAQVKAAYKLFERYLTNFCGNIEGKALFKGEADVVVCDAFVGNVLLKSAQGFGQFVMEMFKESLPHNPIFKLPLALLRPSIMRLRQRLDYAEYGGAPLLGVNGICLICHGHSNAKAICNAILLAQKGYEHHLLELISARAQELHGERSHAL